MNTISMRKKRVLRQKSLKFEFKIAIAVIDE